MDGSEDIFFTPDRLLLVILLGGFFIILMSAAIYTYGWAWCQKVQELPEIKVGENFEPAKIGRRGSLNIQAASSPPPPKGPGYYTSPTWTTSPAVTNLPLAAADHSAITLDLSVRPAEWIGGYMLGLSSALGSEIIDDSSLYIDNMWYTMSNTGSQQGHTWDGKDPSYYTDVGGQYECEEAGETCETFDDTMHWDDGGGVIAGLF